MKSGPASPTLLPSTTLFPSIGSAGANTTIDCPATPSFTPPTASDACGGATVNVLVPDVTTAGTCANKYSVTRTWDATDACGKQSRTARQTVTLTDITPPTIG